MTVQAVYNTHPLRQITRCPGEQIVVGEPADLRSLLKLLEERYGDSFACSLYESKGDRLETALLCDGRGVRSLDQPLRDGSTVNFVMLATGG